MKYEYRMVNHDLNDDDSIMEMNGMGNKGWEIIRIFDPKKWSNAPGEYIRTIYKRIKEETPSE